MTNYELTKYISPPTEPIDVPTANLWSEVEAELGVEFPNDYKQLISIYGNGLLGNFYWVWNPYYKEDFITQVRDICGNEESSRTKFPEYYPYEIYPSKPGFLPCASDDNGNYYGWYTKGEPDSWPILTHEVRGKGFNLYNMSLTGYLSGVFSGEVVPLAGKYPSKSDYVFEKQKSA